MITDAESSILAQLMEQVATNNVQDGNSLKFAFCIAIAAAFGFMLKTMYELYFQDNEPQDGSLARSLVLLAPTFTAIFWMVQNSMVLSLGLLGSLSVVRFRTPIKRAEDIAFVVILLAVSISCAIGQYPIAMIITGFLFGYSVLRNRPISATKKDDRFAILTFNSRQVHSAEQVTSIFKNLAMAAEFVSSRTYDGITSYVFNVPHINTAQHDKLTEALAARDAEAHINFIFPNERLGA